MAEIGRPPVQERRHPNRKERRLMTFGKPTRSLATEHEVAKRRRANKLAAESRRRNRQ